MRVHRGTSRHRFIALMAALAAVPACALLAQAGPPREYVNREKGIAFPVPEGYRTSPADKPLLVRYERASGDGVVAWFNLSCLKIPARFPQDRIPPGVEDEVVAAMEKDGLESLNSARFKVKGCDALSVGLRGEDAARPGIVMRGRSLCIVRAGRLYTFTFAAEEGLFPKETKAFEKVVNGVRWL